MSTATLDVQAVPMQAATWTALRKRLRLCMETRALQILNPWHEWLAWSQDKFNAESFHQVITGDIRDELAALLECRWQDLLIQRQAYLRAARPNVDGQESVGWHRESFYGCPEHALNVWVPLMGCVPENVIRYVPGSADIPNEAIETVADESHGIERGSAGHKVGLLYAPKRIVSVVDFSTAQPLPFKEGHASVFSAQLIHGAAQNRTNQIRFSVDFRVTTKEAAAGGKDMWEGIR
jgi:hypothetical protein